MREDGASRVSIKLFFYPNTSTDIVDVVRQLGSVADLPVPSSHASLLSVTAVRVGGARPGIADQRILHTFNPAKCHPGINIDQDSSTATVTAKVDRD